ncbi:MAG TPA: hypothetical protein VHE35_06010 [Kofleriaceae bacterium]|nr:hypothetical protein [Kofleriaceae bacterium]
MRHHSSSKRGAGRIATGLLLALPLTACHGDKKDVKQPATAGLDCGAYQAPAGAAKWMSWEGGVDVAGMTEPGLQMPNVIVHVAKVVHTPVGSAPSGMIFYQPDPKAQPVVMGFVSTDPKVAAYFGPNIFAGTPFEGAPALTGAIDVSWTGDGYSTHTEVGGHVFDVTMAKSAEAAPIDRPPAAMTPFHQQGTETGVGAVTVKVDGNPIELTVLPQGIAGGPGAVWAPCGVYSR